MNWLQRIIAWTLKYDPRTWAGHSLLVSLGGLVLGVILSEGAALAWSLALGIGLSVALALYVAREATEMHEHWQTLRSKVFDHFMDILCPSLAINIVYRLCTL